MTEPAPLTIPRPIELLAPARDAGIAMEAIRHGADAVYMGGPSHGARKAAANSVDDFKRVVEFAHPFRAKVYATVNTIVHDRELASVERLITGLWEAGVDAVIVQDMGILRLDLPPIQLHASTQCHTDTPEKARFLQEAGFSQIVLARELSFEEIGEICRSVSVPVECFCHGALCVSYSGRCHASFSVNGRSANRGECSQICRLPFNLTDADGNVLMRDRHLLSLKDFNTIDCIPRMLEAGVGSFKIEGRLKDADYVKNVTAAYRRAIDKALAGMPLLRRSSAGTSEVTFEPRLEKSFNRGFTHYFLDGPRPPKISSPLTNKSLGEPLGDVSEIRNGDGISYFTKAGEFTGSRINNVTTADLKGLQKCYGQLYRTFDSDFERRLGRETAKRLIGIDIQLDTDKMTARDERGLEVSLPWDTSEFGQAQKPQDRGAVMAKVGGEGYRLRSLQDNLPADLFIPASRLTDARRHLTGLLTQTAAESYQRELRAPENRAFPYPFKLSYLDNVSNSLARQFYEDHGATVGEMALETGTPAGVGKGTVVMTCRHCLLRDNGLCLREPGGKGLRQPLTLSNGNLSFRLNFDCRNCRMQLLKN